MDIESVNGVVFIAGSDKNAGKTTLFNYLSCALGGKRRAFLTVGVNGDSVDQVFGNAKPHIHVRAGDIVGTTEALLAESDAGCRIMEVFPEKTALGRFVLARAERGGRVKMGGPENNARLADAVAALRARYGAELVLVDGAVNRITQVASCADAGYIYVLRADRATLDSGAGRVRMIYEMSLLPKVPDGDAGYYRAPGAFTRQRALSVPKDAKKVLLDDFTCVFMDYRDWKAFSSRHEPAFTFAPRLLFFCVNLYDVSEAEFLSRLPDSGLASKIIFNPYINERN